MKGINSTEFVDVLAFIQKYHKFALCQSDKEVSEMQTLYPKLKEYSGKNIKYVDSCYDSRFRDIWCVSFRGMGNDICFHTNTDLTLPYDNLFEWVMAYLKLEWVPTNKESESIAIEKK